MCLFSVALSLVWYTFMVTFCWLNGMCIHLWRIVTTMNSISTRSFYIYALYALGLPLICRILFYTDRLISGLRRFSNRAECGELNQNKYNMGSGFQLLRITSYYKYDLISTKHFKKTIPIHAQTFTLISLKLSEFVQGKCLVSCFSRIFEKRVTRIFIGRYQSSLNLHVTI